jgi:hypothetical protein
MNGQQRIPGSTSRGGNGLIHPFEFAVFFENPISRMATLLVV